MSYIVYHDNTVPPFREMPRKNGPLYGMNYLQTNCLFIKILRRHHPDFD